jgi:hypothetical protein
MGRFRVERASAAGVTGRARRRLGSAQARARRGSTALKLEIRIVTRDGSQKAYIRVCGESGRPASPELGHVLVGWRQRILAVDHPHAARVEL